MANSMADGEKRYEFIWRIENFNSKLPKIGNMVFDNKCQASPRFQVYMQGYTEWYLELYPRTGSNCAFIKCLPICSEYSKDISVTCEISILEKNGQVKASKEVNIKCSGVYHCDFSNALEYERAKIPLQEALVLRCILFYSEDKEEKDEIINDLEYLSEDLRKLYSNHVLKDLTVQIGTDKFLIHRNILCIRASKLAEKLDIQDDNNYKTIVQLDKISSSAFRALLLYLYTGKIDMTSIDDFLPELCEAAEEYELDPLKAELLPAVIQSVVRTKLKSLKEYFSWKISEITTLTTPVKKLVDMKICRFVVTLYPSESNFQVRFKCISFSEKETVYLRCKMCVIDVAGGFTMHSNHENCFESDELTQKIGIVSKVTWYFPTPLNKIKLISNKYKYLSNDVLNLRMELELTDGEIVNDVLETKRVLKEQSSKIVHLDYLSNDFQEIFKVKNRPLIGGDFYDEDCYNDVVLKIADKEIGCHKSVLSARSATFANILLDTTCKEIKISDLDYETLLLMIQYIYSGKLSSVAAIEITRLYIAAEKYKIPPLAKKCSFLLENALTIQNVCDVLVLADQHASEVLASILKFINKNQREVFDSLEWKNLTETNPQLTTRIATKTSENKRPREFYVAKGGSKRGRKFALNPRGRH